MGRIISSPVPSEPVVVRNPYSLDHSWKSGAVSVVSNMPSMAETSWNKRKECMFGEQGVLPSFHIYIQIACDTEKGNSRVELKIYKPF